jgi:hypothetical protein
MGSHVSSAVCIAYIKYPASFDITYRQCITYLEHCSDLIFQARIDAAMEGKSVDQAAALARRICMLGDLQYVIPAADADDDAEPPLLILNITSITALTTLVLEYAAHIEPCLRALKDKYDLIIDQPPLVSIDIPVPPDLAPFFNRLPHIDIKVSVWVINHKHRQAYVRISSMK